MEAYESFAAVYDLFMDNVPYEEWTAFILEKLKEYGITDGILADLGCGTGVMTRLLAAQGYDMIGIDNSISMLEMAKEQGKEGDGILYLCQDMQEFELYGTVKAVISACDSLNYLCEDGELEQVFRLVDNYLDPKGVFVFDFNTRYKYETLLGEATIVENREEGSFIWENYFDEETDINEYDMTFFIRQENDLYQKFEETHFQRAYTLEQVKQALKQAGLEFLQAYDGYTKEPAKEDSERIVVLAREQKK